MDSMITSAAMDVAVSYTHLTGILLAFNLPVTINPLMAAFGGVVAIVVVKQM